MFVTPTWDSDAKGDKTCKELFKNKYSAKVTKLKKKGKPRGDNKIKKDTNHEMVKHRKLQEDAKNSAKQNTKKISKQQKKMTKISDSLKSGNSNNGQTPLKSKKLGKKHKKSNNQIQETHVNKKKPNRKRKLETNKPNELPPKKKKGTADPIDQTTSNMEQNCGPKTKKLKWNKMNLSLRERMLEKLKAARFRYINEQIYTNSGHEIKKYFENDVDAFKAYHAGYRQQVQRWNINPVDIIIKSVKKMPKHFEIADFGCGDAKLSKSVEQKVHSFDVIAVDESVTACDMAHVPLKDHTIDVVVFCLSLMGTNLQDYLLEANRVLKIGGVLKIAEVESRFDSIDEFIKGVEHFGFTKVWKDLSHKLFYFMDFKKEKDVSRKKNLPTISLNPCLYKKR